MSDNRFDMLEFGDSKPKTQPNSQVFKNVDSLQVREGSVAQPNRVRVRQISMYFIVFPFMQNVNSEAECKPTLLNSTGVVTIASMGWLEMFCLSGLVVSP